MDASTQNKEPITITTTATEFVSATARDEPLMQLPSVDFDARHLASAPKWVPRRVATYKMFRMWLVNVLTLPLKIYNNGSKMVSKDSSIG